MRKFSLVSIILLGSFTALQAQELFKIPADKPQTRWVSPENPTGEKGQGGKVNKGAKGQAFYIIAPGEKKIIFNVKGAGVIQRIWVSGTIPVDAEQRRSVRLDMFWDDASKAAVSAPIGDFFGEGLGLISSFENDFFASPEGRSYNCTIPMPYRAAARMELTNESTSYVLLWYDVDFLKLGKQADDALYFHAFWSRELRTTLGKDFVILPLVKGKGRYLGSNIGVIANPGYQHAWFGEGEIKMYLDGDRAHPSIVGTGTEDYIGSGWGQGKFSGPYHGSLISDEANGLYAFYRFHIADPVYFYSDCQVAIQQIGSANPPLIRDMISHKVPLQPVWYFNSKGMHDVSGDRSKGPEEVSLLDLPGSQVIDWSKIPDTVNMNFYRSDDLSATAYFYLDNPAGVLPGLPSLELRMKDLKKEVFEKTDPAFMGK